MVERLLSEFRAIVLNTPMPKLTAEEIAVAAGPLRIQGTGMCIDVLSLLSLSLSPLTSS
jgi:hypothetical protein